MNELGMMGGGFDMGQLYEPMGGQMMDPNLEMAIQDLVQRYGLTPEQAMELAMGQQPTPPSMTPPGILGGQPPQLSEQDYMMLAQQFGIDPTSTMGGQDPAYSNQYDMASILGGPYEP